MNATKRLWGRRHVVDDTLWPDSLEAVVDPTQHAKPIADAP